MPFAEFTDDLRVGHDEIDRQHLGLFEAINCLHDALRAGRSRQEQTDILAFLHTYTVEHFQTEEAVMRDSGYPALEAHQELHRTLVQQVNDLEEKYALGTMTLSIMTMHFLKDWLTNHIQAEDQKFAAFRRAK
ncbi:MAG: bacteriohemerythrin [Holophaga sp.]|nr:bacteriohemerythrin [Holophaga sp.]